MPRESCIQHRKGERLIIIRESYVDLLGGDYCAAGVLSYLEYLTNGELERMNAAEENGEPWVKASANKIQVAVLDMYKDRSIRYALGRLSRHGIIREDREHAAAVKRYLLQIENLNELLERRVVLSEPPAENAGGNQDPPALPPALPPAEAAAENAGGSCRYIKEEVKSNKVENHTSGGDPINTEAICKTLGSRFKRLKGVTGFNLAAKLIVSQRVEKLDAGLSEEDILEAFDHWSDLDYWREYDTPGKVRAFFKHLSDNPPDSPPRPEEIPRLKRNDPEELPRPSAAPVIPPSLPLEAAVWNSTVKHGIPVTLFAWNMPEGISLARCRRHEDFTEDAWVKICEKVESVLSGGNEKASFLASFQWVIRDNANWWKVLTGSYDHMAGRRSDRPAVGEVPAHIRESIARSEARRKAHANPE